MANILRRAAGEQALRRLRLECELRRNGSEVEERTLERCVLKFKREVLAI